MYNYVSEMLREWIDRGEITGAAVRARYRGEMIVDDALGVVGVGSSQPVTSKTMFQLCSMSKPITGVLAMKLVEQGLLDLEMPVMKLIPDYAHMPKLTVRMLMDHTSGIAISGSPNPFPRVQSDTLAEHVARMAKHPLDFPNGESVAYSGMGSFDILGRILEIITGMTFEEYLKTALTDPLKMPDTGFSLTEEQYARKMPLYEYTPGQPLKDVTDTDPLMQMIDPRKVNHVSGSGGMVGTLDDYDRFVQMLLNEGELDGARILKPETVRQMHVPSSANGLECDPGCVWGLSMKIFRDNARSKRALYDGTYGWSGAYGTHFFVAPAQQLCLTLMLNRSNIGGGGSPISFAAERAVKKMVEEG